RLRQGEDRQELLEPFPGSLRSLTSPSQRQEPRLAEEVAEPLHGAVVEDDAVISVMPLEHLAEPVMLFAHWEMQAFLHFRPQRLQLADHAFGLGLLFYLNT